MRRTHYAISQTSLVPTMADETEKEQHLRRLLDFERKQRADERERLYKQIDTLEERNKAWGAAYLLGLFEGVVWDRLLKSKAKAAGAEYVVQFLREQSARAGCEPNPRPGTTK